MLLLIDNYDSFVHNLARYFERLGQATRVVRNDQINTADIRSMRPSAIIISPGPCSPTEAGASLDIARAAIATTPLLGVCLGHQVIAQTLGGRIVPAPVPMHGRPSLVRHDRRGLFTNVPTPLSVGRYHSLVVDPGTLPAELRATAWTSDSVLMAFEHVDRPVFGVQFHPESILTQCGYVLLANFLRRAGLPVSVRLGDLANDELLDQTPKLAPLPRKPVTF